VISDIQAEKELPVEKCKLYGKADSRSNLRTTLESRKMRSQRGVL
jgi:hypothetical protein